MKRSAVILALAAIFLAATALAGSPPNNPPQPQETQLTKLDNKNQGPEGPSVSQQWHPNGIPAGEAHYLNGQKHGPYSLWYPNGVVKVKCRYDRGKLDGPCEAWFEIGPKRLSIFFDKGRKDGEWLRFGEKVRDVAKLRFSHDVLNGPVWVLINRGSGSGTGTSYQLTARYEQGRIVGPFKFSYTDMAGREVMLAGSVEAGRPPVVEETENVTVSPQGMVTVAWAEGVKKYPGVEEFFVAEMKRKVMPLFTLDYCGVRYDPAVKGGSGKDQAGKSSERPERGRDSQKAGVCGS